MHYTLVVLQIVVQDYIVVVVRCYIVVVMQFLFLYVHPTPYMYLQSFISSSPRFYIPFLCVQLTYKSYKMYSLVLSNIYASGGNDRDHTHVFCVDIMVVVGGIYLHV